MNIIRKFFQKSANKTTNAEYYRASINSHKHVNPPREIIEAKLAKNDDHHSGLMKLKFQTILSFHRWNSHAH